MNSIVVQRGGNLQPVDPIWTSVRDEAREAAERDPLLSAFLYSSILNHETLEEAVIHRIAERLGHPDLGSDIIRHTFKAMLRDRPEWGDIVRVDIQAYYDRDPACDRFLMPVLYFKGFHAIQTHRLAHWLWTQGRKDFALYLQSRSSAVFQTDIHPASKMGKGIFIDHATGLVVGETARDRGQCLDPAWRDARRHRQGRHRSPSEDPLRRADRRRRQDPRQYRGRPLRQGRGRLGRAGAGSAQQDGGRRAGRASSARPAATSRRGRWTSSCRRRRWTRSSASTSDSRCR